MKTYFKVITEITDRRGIIYFGGEVVANKKPQNTCKETRLCDKYEDFFETKEEAEAFIKTQRKGL